MKDWNLYFQCAITSFKRGISIVYLLNESINMESCNIKVIWQQQS